MLLEYQRYSRHVRSLAEHASPKKLRNFLTVELEYRRRAIYLRGKPYKVIIDPCNICYMGCRLCPNGMNELKRQKKKMDFETFRTVVDILKPYAFEVSLHNWGEPLLNTKIYQMIGYARANNIGTNLSTTLATVDPADIDELIKSGLEYLVVSIDGASPETYNQYTPRADFARVLENLRALIRRRDKLLSPFPIVEWQFLVMRHNEHEISEAKKMAREMGVDRLRLASAGLPMERFNDRKLAREWMTTNKKYWRLNPLKLETQSYLLDQPCFYLYRSMTVNPDGSVSPCCALYDEKYDFGNLLDDGLEALWNNERYQSARSSFSTRPKTDNRETICTTCQLFRHP